MRDCKDEEGIDKGQRGDELLSDKEVQNQNIVVSSTLFLLTRLGLSRVQTERQRKR